MSGNSIGDSAAGKYLAAQFSIAPKGKTVPGQKTSEPNVCFASDEGEVLLPYFTTSQLLNALSEKPSGTANVEGGMPESRAARLEMVREATAGLAGLTSEQALAKLHPETAKGFSQAFA